MAQTTAKIVEYTGFRATVTPHGVWIQTPAQVAQMDPGYFYPGDTLQQIAARVRMVG